MRTMAASLAILGIAAALVLGDRALDWNDQLELAPPLACEPPRVDDPRTPALSRRVVLVLVDGLGAGESHLPFLDELRARGVGAEAAVPYPTLSRPNYVTILTGVPPRDSGIRSNRVHAPVAVDTLMDRVQAAGRRVASASDYGIMVSLFLRNTDTIQDVAWIEEGTRVRPPPPLAWPIDEARRVPALEALGPAIAELARTDAAFIPVLVLDVDRAGHASGVGEAYRGAAAAVDRMLREAFAGLDLARDTVVVTADHGHVAPGGHGGVEPEVSHVPLILAGAGVVPGAAAPDARLVDVAPTVAALLGVPAPGHASGRTLVELLALDDAARARRLAADEHRAAALAPTLAEARGGGPDLAHLVACVAGLTFAGGGFAWRRRLALSRASAVGAIALLAMFAAPIAITRFTMSPSYIPSAYRVMRLGVTGVVASIAVQLVVAWLVVVRRATDRLAAACGVAVVGLAASACAVALVRAWWSPPFHDVPPPFWMVAIPAVDLAAATCALAGALTIGLGALPRRRATLPG